MTHPVPSIVAVALAAAFIAVGPAGAESIEKGAACFEAKDYACARAHWEPLAKSGSTAAQMQIGALYANGMGVERDVTTAYMWFALAAKAGDAKATAAMKKLEPAMSVEQIDTALDRARAFRPSRT